MRSFTVVLMCGLLVACDEGGAMDTGGDGDTDGMANEVLACEDLLADVDVTACSPNVNDYTPGGDDRYGACAPDDGGYPLIADTPSSIARVEAYDAIMGILRGDAVPTADDFTMARNVYAEDEGLESRLQRREDLHYPPVPMEDWVDGVDSDKQCTAAENVEAYPDRCAGPAQIAPIMNEAFAAGQTGDGDPEVLAARIDAAATWFLYLSVFKEANTCFSNAAKDCDSSWAYYTGGFDRAGGIGFSAKVQAVDPMAHEAIWNGITAFRCLRELEAADEDPTISDLDENAQGMLCHANAQLDTALDYGLAQVLIAAIEEHVDTDEDARAPGWAYLQILGPVLDRPLRERDTAAADRLATLWGSDAPTDDDLNDAIETIDTNFPCP